MLYYLYEREPSGCRASFAPANAAELAAPEEGVHWLDSGRMPEPADTDPYLRRMLAENRVRAVNLSHPRWREAMGGFRPGAHKRLHLLAAGDVGGTLLVGLRLLGGASLSSIGLCDIDSRKAARWEMELGRSRGLLAMNCRRYGSSARRSSSTARSSSFARPRGVPPVGAAGADVRMAQYEKTPPWCPSMPKRRGTAAFAACSPWSATPWTFCAGRPTTSPTGAGRRFRRRRAVCRTDPGLRSRRDERAGRLFCREGPRFSLFLSRAAPSAPTARTSSSPIRWRTITTGCRGSSPPWPSAPTKGCARWALSHTWRRRSPRGPAAPAHPAGRMALQRRFPGRRLHGVQKPPDPRGRRAGKPAAARNSVQAHRKSRPKVGGR